MPRTIQHILLDLEVAPPADAWQQVAARLDLEYDQAEIRAAQKLSDLEVAPPAAAWQHIAAALGETVEEDLPAPATPARTIRIPFRKLAAAAVITGIALFAGWYLLGTGNNNAQAPTALNKEVPPTDNITVIQTPPPGTDSTNNLPTPIVSRPSPGKAYPARPAETGNENTLADIAAPDIDYVTPHTTVQPETATTASVPAPPIRDKSGNIVMDLRLLVGAGAGNNYITVTGPNGEQTRISRKFLPMLIHLSSGLENGQNNDQWKNRFREWRDKLLRQASFAPSATNFLDIMELKEMIEEK